MREYVKIVLHFYCILVCFFPILQPASPMSGRGEGIIAHGRRLLGIFCGKWGKVCWQQTPDGEIFAIIGSREQPGRDGGDTYLP